MIYSLILPIAYLKSRSTWACELKFLKQARKAKLVQVTLHVSVWVEIKQELLITLSPSVTLHVSVWVEIIVKGYKGGKLIVTLHVSVWVEIGDYTMTMFNITSRSTWACELKWKCRWHGQADFGSRSTWACELKLNVNPTFYTEGASRSTWACELKLSRIIDDKSWVNVTLHVSVWVEM